MLGQIYSKTHCTLPPFPNYIKMHAGVFVDGASGRTVNILSFRVYFMNTGKRKSKKCF